jgi:predicted peptidase
MRCKLTYLLFISLLTCFALSAQDNSPYQKHEWINNSDTLRYRMLLPENYDSTKQYPVILFLHGAGERGSDNQAQLTHGSTLFTRPDIRTNYPAIVLFPQCPTNDWWANVEMKVDSANKKIDFNFLEEGEPTHAMSMLTTWFNEFISTVPVVKSQVYVMGLSMGGMGTFEIVRRMPNVFAAAIPICGGANPATAKKIRRTPFWIFHGQADPVVPVKLSEDMAIALQQFYDAAEMQLTIYPGVKHNSWDNAFRERELLPWLFSQLLKK